jgi:hypothetical protein
MGTANDTLFFKDRCPVCGRGRTSPIWSYLSFVTACGFLTFLLYSNASNFDATELKTLFWFATAVAGFKFGLGPQMLKLLERFVPGKG